MTDDDLSTTDDNQLAEPGDTHDANGGQPSPPASGARPRAGAGANGRRNGAGPGGQVRSGLAHRRNPALVALGDFAQGTRKMLFRDLLTTFLALASIALALAFALLLSSIGPSSRGAQIPISRVETLAKQHNVKLATLLDHDNRVEIVTRRPAQRIAVGVVCQLGRADRAAAEHASGRVAPPSSSISSPASPRARSLFSS